MKRIVLFALTVVVCMFDFGESTPATLCKYLPCSRTCAHQFILVVRNRYRGGTEDGVGMCSRDNVFCVRYESNGIVLRYQNADRLIKANQWQQDNADDWCRRLRDGQAYWFEA